jgi:hypothetical protein
VSPQGAGLVEPPGQAAALRAQAWEEPRRSVEPPGQAAFLRARTREEPPTATASLRTSVDDGAAYAYASILLHGCSSSVRTAAAACTDVRVPVRGVLPWPTELVPRTHADNAEHAGKDGGHACQPVDPDVRVEVPLSPKTPLPSSLPQHHPGLLTWLSRITITSFSPKAFTPRPVRCIAVKIIKGSKRTALAVAPIKNCRVALVLP